MNRGVIHLTPLEINFILSSLGQPSPEESLRKKLLLSDLQQPEQQFEVSEEEINTLLDLLPPPGPTAPPEVASIRPKLLGFLDR